MMRSLFSGVSGLKVHQTKMDVIGNNIANVNTVGFKSSSVNFSDVFYQTMSSASGPNNLSGSAGTNGMQIGLGSDVASVAVNITSTGGTQRTERGLDLMLNGEAFFVVQSEGETYFTKSGAMGVDESGNLYCTSNGASVMGWQVDNEGNIVKDKVSTLKIMSADRMYAPPVATTKVTLSGNIDQKDKEVAYDADKTGRAVAINFYDKLGTSYLAKLNIMQENNSTNTYTVKLGDVVDSNNNSILVKKTTDTNGNTVFASTGQYLKLGENALTYTVNATTGEITITGDSSILTFNGANGDFTSVGDDGVKSLNLCLNNGTGANNPFVTEGTDIDFSALTMYSSGGSTTIEPKRGDADGNGSGNMAGNLTGYKFSEDGKIYGVYDNGKTSLFGQVAVATFSNPAGLESVGGSLFRETLNSGSFDGIGEDVSISGGVTIGALEMSNVDLSTEFTNMITTQRGFQANSRIITTSDTMLEELINLKR